MMIVMITRVKMFFVILAKKSVKNIFNFFCISITGVHVLKKMVAARICGLHIM